MARPRMTADVGRVLGGRYRLVAPIGAGSSAQVFLADDMTLRRRVAVKMLHESLASDARFLRRFRAEARAAAALSHPNVMAVYDWGDDDVAFIVSEFLPGGSLRALIDRKALLSPAQTLEVALEASRALDYAHRRGFVHRDVKPANLLFGEDQRLRIADFGLARALAEAAWTEPFGAVVGTARYASPEQARGERSTGKSDVYSLALVVVEAVTGEVPFVTDTMVATLMARAHKTMEVPDALGPLQAIVRQAGHPDPEERIDARAFAMGLLKAAKDLSRPAPLLLVDRLDLGPPSWVNTGAELPATSNAHVDVTDAAVARPQWRSARPSMATEAIDQVVDPIGVHPPAQRDRGNASRHDDVDRGVADHPDSDGSGFDSGVDTGGERLFGTGRRRVLAVLAVLALLAAGGGLVARATGARHRSRPAASSVLPSVPRLDGLAPSQARAVLRARGWKVAAVHTRRDGTTAGTLLGTQPKAGARLARGRTVTLSVSEGQTIVRVPDGLVARTGDEARFILGTSGLVGTVAASPFDERVGKGQVIAVAPGVSPELEKGTTVGLLISAGPRPRTVPVGMLGASVTSAKASLSQAQLKMSQLPKFSSTVPVGRVIAISPRPGATVPRGSTVTVAVSKGPELRPVPSVAGSGTIAAAVVKLRSAGFAAGGVSGPATGTPRGTSPAAGTAVKPGSSVNIVLG